MTYEGRNAVIGLIVSVIVNIYIVLRLRGLFASGAFDGPDALQVFGKTVLWVVPIAIGLTIAATILGNIIAAIVTNDPDPEYITDERDRLFQNRGMIATMVVTSLGFLLAMVALALGWDALKVFILIYFSFAIGSIAGDLTKLISYQIGG